jgi:hypothetical protein
MSPQELAYAIQGMSDEQLAQLPHWMLYSARAYIPKEAQDRIAPYEHRAFARESVGENPLMALPTAIGTLAYQPYKMLMGQSRSAPSIGQMGQGLMGVYEGMTGKASTGQMPGSL